MDDFQNELGSLNELLTVKADYAKTLALLRAIKAGRVTLDRVQLTDNGWNLLPLLAVVEDAEPDTEAA